MTTWVLIFMFAGQGVVSGKPDRETCLSARDRYVQMKGVSCAVCHEVSDQSKFLFFQTACEATS